MGRDCMFFLGEDIRGFCMIFFGGDVGDDCFNSGKDCLMLRFGSSLCGEDFFGFFSYSRFMSFNQGSGLHLRGGEGAVQGLHFIYEKILFLSSA